MYDKVSSSFAQRDSSKDQLVNSFMESGNIVLFTKESKEQIMPTQSHFPSIDGTCGSHNSLATSSPKSFGSIENFQKISDVLCPHCYVMSHVQRNNAANGFSKICVCETYVQYVDMKHCDNISTETNEAKTLSSSKRSKDCISFARQQSGQNMMLELAQAVKFFFIIIAMMVLSRTFKTRSTYCMFHVALSVLVLICASASCDALTGEGPGVKTAPFSPCSHVMRTTSRQVYTRHPSNCSTFYMCYGNQHWELSCTQNNTVFSLLHSVCVWKGSKYDDCSLHATGLTTAYAWNRIPFRGNDMRQKFGKDVQHKIIDVVVPSTKNEEEAITATPVIEVNPEVDTRNASTISTKSPSDLWARSKNAVIELARDTSIKGLHSNKQNDSTYHSLNNELENHTNTTDFSEDLSSAKETPRKVNRTQIVETQHATSEQVFRGYSIQYPTLDNNHLEHLETEVYKSSNLEMKKSNLGIATNTGNNIVKLEDIEELDSVSPEFMSSDDVTNKVHISIDESNFTPENDADVGLHIDEYSVVSQVSPTEEPEVDTSKSKPEMESIGTTISEDGNAQLSKNIDLNDSGDNRVLKGPITDNIDTDTFKYRDIYIRDRWPKFDIYGTRFVGTENSDKQYGPVDESQTQNSDERVIDYKRTEDSVGLNDRSDLLRSYQHGGRNMWLHTRRPVSTPIKTTRKSLVPMDNNEYELQNRKLSNQTLLGKYDGFVESNNRMGSEADILEQYQQWFGRIPLRFGSATSTDTLITQQFIQSIIRPTSPTLTESKSQGYRLLNLVKGKNAADTKTAYANPLKDSLGKRSTLTAEPFKLNSDIDIRFPFGRPWARHYPRRVESSIFKSTLKPTRRPSHLQQRNATDNPKLMERFLRLLNIPKPGTISTGTQLVRNNRVIQEKLKDAQILDKKVTIGNLLKAASIPKNYVTQATRPQKNAELTTKKDAKPTFTFSKPSLTWTSRRRNFNQSFVLPTRIPWPKDRLSGSFDTLKTKYHVTKSQNVINTNTLNRVLPSYNFVPANQRVISVTRSTLQSPKTPLGRDSQHSLGVKPRAFFKVTRQPIPRQSPTNGMQAPIQGTFPRQNVQQSGMKADPEIKRAQLQKLREKHLQSLQKPSKQNYFPARHTPSFLTHWYPTNFNVFYQMYKPFVNTKTTQKVITQRTTQPNNDSVLKRNSHQSMPNPHNAKLWDKSNSRDGYKVLNVKSKPDMKLNTPAPRISERKLDILRQLTPKLWSRLIPESRRRDVAKPSLETTTMQIYVKPTFLSGQKQEDVSGAYWWDRNTRGPKYFIPTLPAILTTATPKAVTTRSPTTTLATTLPPRTTTSTIPTTTTTATTSTTTSTTTTSTTTTATTPEPTFIPSTYEPDQRTRKWPSFVGPDYIPEYRKEMQDRCGIMGRPLIIGGRKSRSGQWPWQVSLQIVTSTTPWHRCGGVLVHARWVLTAAHCVEGSFYGDIRNWRVVLADYDLDTVSGNEIYREVVRIISHPEYVRTSNFPNDIALLELDSPVDLTSGEVQTACLPDSSMPLGAGTQCWISGWGETRGSGGSENMMNEVPVDVVSNQECQDMWGKVNIDVLETQVCLGYGDTGACYGDSGGPLMCEDQGRFYVSGVMSWLINNCSATNFPNVFTRLPNYMDWVYEHLDYFEWLRYL